MPTEEKTVDLDTSGPGAEIELPETEQPESNIEVSNDTENNTESNDSTEKSDEQSLFKQTQPRTKEQKRKKTKL